MLVVTASAVQKAAKAATMNVLLALALPLLAIMPLLTHAGLPNTADGPVHLMRQVELNQAWQEGHLYPRWGTDLALGHGMPIFSYAPPALYQLTQIFHLFGLPLDEAMKGVLVLDFLLYSLGMFLFARRIFGPGPALLAAAVYVYAPYRLREAYIQGNYGQFTGLAFYPLIFWAFHGLITDGRPGYLIAAAVSLAGLLLSHNISFMLFAPMFAAYLLFLLVAKGEGAKGETTKVESGKRKAESGKRNPKILMPALRSSLFALRSSLFASSSARTAAGLLLGLGLAAIFWLPAFGEQQAIKLEGITRGFFDFRENYISLSELLAPPLPLDLAAINPEFPLSLGLPQIIGAGLGLLGLIFLLFKSTRNRQYAIRFPRLHCLFFTFFLLLYAFLALPQSEAVWEAVPLLELAEFPWRMLGPAIFCASFLAAFQLSIINEQLSIFKPKWSWFIAHGLWLIAILAVIALNAYYLYPSQFIPWGTPTPTDAFAYEMASGAIGTTSTGEFLPRGAQQHPEPETLWPDYERGRPPQKIDPASLPPGALVEILSHQAEADSVRITTPQAFVATLRTLYWPGWRLYLDGQPTTLTVTEKTGLIQTTIPAGQHSLSLQLESTPLRTIGRWLTLLSAALLVIVAALAFSQKRRLRQAQPDKPDRPQPAAAILGPFNPFPSPGFMVVAIGLLIGLYLVSRPLAPLFTLQSDPNRPRPADRPLQVDFGDQIRLVGLDEFPPAIPLTGGRPADLIVTVYWRALQNLETNYSVFLHLDAPNGQTFATTDEVNPENIPTANWPPGLYLRNPLHLTIPDDIPPIRYDLNVGLYQRQDNQRLSIRPGQATTFTLGSIWLTGPQPRLANEPLAHFGQNITLLQAVYPQAQDQALILYWQTGQPIDRNYSIFVHWLDEAGHLLGQNDGVPYAGLYPPVNWQPGQIIIDRRPWPATLHNRAQLDALAIGLYDPTTGERLPATDAAGQALPNNSFMLSVSP